MALLFSVACVVLLWFLYNIYCFLSNYRRASQLEIPVVIAPISPDNPLWIALQTGFSSIFRYIPFEIFSFTRHCRLGWEFHDRYKTHQRLGDSWILVTPDRNWFHTSKAEVAYDILSRSRDLGRPVWMSSMLACYLTVIRL